MSRKIYVLDDNMKVVSKDLMFVEYARDFCDDNGYKYIKIIDNGNEQIYQRLEKGIVKLIGGIPITTWKEKIADLVRLAMNKDYFDDILFYELYPNTAAEAAAIDEDDEDAQCDVYNSKWEYAYEAFEEIFGEKY